MQQGRIRKREKEIAFYFEFQCFSNTQLKLNQLIELFFFEIYILNSPIRKTIQKHNEQSGTVFLR